MGTMGVSPSYVNNVYSECLAGTNTNYVSQKKSSHGEFESKSIER
jgi:hypothetical protein